MSDEKQEPEVQEVEVQDEQDESTVFVQLTPTQVSILNLVFQMATLPVHPALYVGRTDKMDDEDYSESVVRAYMLVAQITREAVIRFGEDEARLLRNILGAAYIAAIPEEQRQEIISKAKEDMEAIGFHAEVDPAFTVSGNN